MAKGKKTGGRAPGAKNKLTRDALDKAKATGETPADVLLRMMRETVKEYEAFVADQSFETMLAKATSAEGVKAFQEMQRERRRQREGVGAAAEAAAPYFNPKLSNVDARVTGRVVVMRKTLAAKRTPANRAGGGSQVSRIDEAQAVGDAVNRAARRVAGAGVRVRKGLGADDGG